MNTTIISIVVLLIIIIVVIIVCVYSSKKSSQSTQSGQINRQISSMTFSNPVINVDDNTDPAFVGSAEIDGMRKNSNNSVKNRF